MGYLKFTGGIMQENCYILIDEDTGIAAVIDPGFTSEALLNELQNWDVRIILLTHGHFDHMGAAEEIKERTGAPIAAYRTEKELAGDPALNGSSLILKKPMTCAVDQLLEDGEILHFSSIPVQVMHTPGHTAGSCCFVTADVIFTGDTIMNRSVGRYDLPTGSAESLFESLRKIAFLPGNPQICGGHGAVTTLETEKAENAYLAQYVED